MILSCPNCATQYKVNEAVIGNRGRTVRCTSCKTTWFAETPVDLRYSEGRRKELDLEPEDEVANQASKSPKGKDELYQVKAKKLPGKYRAMLADKKRLQALAVEGMVWGGLAAIAIATLTLAYFLRIDIVKAFPRTAGAYAMAGLKVNATHLQFESHALEVNFKGGRFVVTVKAQIKNLSGKTVPVPPVRVKLLDSTKQQFESVLMPSGGLEIEPHATRTLTFDVPDPENMVSAVDLIFDLEAMKHMKPGKAGGAHGEDGHGEPEAHGETAVAANGSEEAHAPAADAHAVPAAVEAHTAPDDAHASQAPDAQAPDAHTTESIAPAPLATQPAPALRSTAHSAVATKPAAAKTSHGGH